MLLSDKLEGIGRYTLELCSRMVKNHPEHEYHFIFDRKPEGEFLYSDRVKAHVLPPPVRHPLLAKIWFDKRLPKLLKKIKPDVFLSPDGMNSLKPVCPTITVLHDLNFVHYPEFFSASLGTYYRLRTPVIADKSDLIVTVSNYSRQDIIATYSLKPAKIEVIYNGASDNIKALGESEKHHIQKDITHGRPYFVFVGGMYHRKNLLNQFKAFEHFKLETGSEVCMVYVGQVVKDADELKRYIDKSEVKDDVFILGRQEEERKRKIMASALALSYVSHNEGFGIPLVEAMKSGIPIITGNTTSMPEICGDAALYADPLRITEIADKYGQLELNAALREDLVSKGYKQMEKFSWDKGSEELMALLKRFSS